MPNHEQDYSLAEDFKFEDVERMLANVPVTRRHFFSYAGISEQNWWEWKKVNRISKHSKTRLSKAYKWFRSEEYQAQQANKRFHLVSLSNWPIEDLVGELERRGATVKIDVTLGVKDGIRPLTEALSQRFLSNPILCFEKKPECLVLISATSDAHDTVIEVADVIYDPKMNEIIKNRFGSLEDLELLKQLQEGYRDWCDEATSEKPVGPPPRELPDGGITAR